MGEKFMNEMYERTQMLFGNENMEKIKNSYVAVFGVGGVGSFACEALARAGIGKIDLIDNDVVSPTNLNRQLVALTSTLGHYKVDVMKDRILDINPNAEVNTYKTFYLPETANEFDFSKYDYIIDAIDTVAGKIQLVGAISEFYALQMGINNHGRNILAPTSSPYGHAA